MSSNIRKFVFQDLHKVEGYIDPPDALVFVSIVEDQDHARMEGGLAEIGVYYGRSYFLLRKITNLKEKVLAVDLFNIGEGGKQYRRFLDNGNLLGIPVDENCVIRGDSTALRPELIKEKVGQVRFFSIDGGHLFQDVVHDSRLAEQSLAPHGVIAFDDTFNPAWPEVTVAVGDFLRSSEDKLKAFCMTKYKTYVCRSEFYDFYVDVIRNSQHLKAFRHEEVDFLGSKVLRLHNPMKRRIAYELLSRSGMKNMSDWAYRTA
ncbi:class I SAM-dependent methyltransferase [Oryzifoliimicrobium ureilyticus]|uniref:class I SAM-dependent methyltransferase n=1 Tax=Oryzifoliimicrobium ureilyticus TaxID=3113724 RepID=UPI0030764B94